MKRAHILVCTGTGCTSAGSLITRDALLAELGKVGLREEVDVVETGCMGRCDLGPVTLVHPDGTFYKNVKAADVPLLVEEHFVKGRRCEQLLPKRSPDKIGDRHAGGLYFFQSAVAHCA